MNRRPQPMRVTPKTRWGRFLVAQREAIGKTQKAVFRETREAMSWGEDSRASYGALERGDREPNPDEQAFFLARYGFDELPAESVEEATPDLAAALLALTAELAAARQERSAWERGVLAVLRTYRGAPVPAELLDALAPQPLEPARP